MDIYKVVEVDFLMIEPGNLKIQGTTITANGFSIEIFDIGGHLMHSVKDMVNIESLPADIYSSKASQ